jgi:hypothetical protein
VVTVTPDGVRVHDDLTLPALVARAD